jgi:glycosyltransferase involved in cell wall biosynthesis
LTYLVLGEGPYRHVLETQIAHLSLGKHVSLLGNRDNIVDFLAAGDIGCLLSRGEAMPLSLIEFMAMQLPVVTSGNPPFEEFVRPGWGALVDEHDARSVAGTLRTLLRDEHLRAKMGKAAREEAIAKYSWPAIAGRYLSILKVPEEQGHNNVSAYAPQKNA